ncbi:hypothetical protein DICVIV_13987 [Dictyocaulus viviparus]|uniref:Uncharacterized protein n=1 Tax=Dictyocaulus viviparus TaxID=29172 RepID=A0A0D8X6C0_DICVI|nr:hypothetical protein DICVIV_13987 [Dictyocaulus viviparus]
MVYTGEPAMPSMASGISTTEQAAKTFVSRLIMDAVIDAAKPATCIIMTDTVTSICDLVAAGGRCGAGMDMLPIPARHLTILGTLRAMSFLRSATLSWLVGQHKCDGVLWIELHKLYREDDLDRFSSQFQSAYVKIRPNYMMNCFIEKTAYERTLSTSTKW